MTLDAGDRSEENELEVGSVLAIPLDEGVWAYGQIAIPGLNFLLCVYSDIVSDLADFAPKPGTEPLLIAWTNDAEVFRGNWKLVGVFPQIGTFVLPEYKVFISGTAVVESAYEEVVREFDPRLDGDLQFRTIRSPMLVQDAVQAAFGYGEWKIGFDDMKLPIAH